MKKLVIAFCLILTAMITAGCQKNDSNITSDPAPFENAKWFFL